MAQLMITGHQARRGAIQVSGAKNASLPLMAACLLTNKNVTLKNVPNISDIENMKEQLQSYRVQVNGNGTDYSSMVLNASNPYPHPSGNRKDIRGAVLVLGPLLARLGEAQLFQPGGCKIHRQGRPINYHIDALKKMGAQVVRTSDSSIHLKAPNGLHGAEINCKYSVGATETTVMAACLAEGETVIKRAAVEPEVIDLVDMLEKMGASIAVYPGDNMIVIGGRRQLLSGVTHTVIPDRIEAGSYAIAAAIVGGPLLLKMDRARAEVMLEPIVKKLREAGVTATWKREGLEVQRPGQISPVDIETGPYPGFPTDLLPQWVTLMTQANGNSKMNDTIYDNRYVHVTQLEKMGACFQRNSNRVLEVYGPAQLRGTRVKAEDLRGGMALVLAALAAQGTTVVKEIEHVRRGYANLEKNLKECGAKFEELPPTRPGHYGGR